MVTSGALQFYKVEIGKKVMLVGVKLKFLTSTVVCAK